MKANIFQLVIAVVVCVFLFYREIKYIKSKKIFKEGSFVQQSYATRSLITILLGLVCFEVSLIVKLVHL